MPLTNAQRVLMDEQVCCRPGGTRIFLQNHMRAVFAHQSTCRYQHNRTKKEDDYRLSMNRTKK